jgi:hypothetical protein
MVRLDWVPVARVRIVGQEAFVEVLSKREKVGGPEGSRAAYFTELIPPDVARAAIVAIPFYGGR